MRDGLGRDISYLRISVTDRCNLRCVYCMPEEGVRQKPHDAMMTLEEIERFVRIVAPAGVRHVRLTGGEPLVRLGISDLVRYIANVPGIEQLSLTTNGLLLPEMAGELKEAGLDRVNISFDTLDPAQYAQITRRDRFADCVAGIEAALSAGLEPVKINAVVVRSLHQDLLGFAKLSLDRPLHMRFIEYMPVGHSQGVCGQGWSKEDTVPVDELIETLNGLAESEGLGRLEPVLEGGPTTWGPARNYRFPNAKGTVGFIAALSNHFCSRCNRLRLTSDGKLRPCLFSDLEFDALDPVRNGSDAEVLDVFKQAIGAKPDEHHYRVGTQRNMSQIGG